MGEYDVISTHEFRIRYVAGNKVRARFDNGEYSKNQIKDNRFWSEIPNFEFPVNFYVSKFTVVCIGSIRVEIKVQGHKLNSVAKKEIEKLEAGQTVIFKDFVVRQKDVDYERELNDRFVLTIEESPDKVIE